MSIHVLFCIHICYLPFNTLLAFRFDKICVGGSWIVTDIRLARVEACIMNARLYAPVSVYITSVSEKEKTNVNASLQLASINTTDAKV